MPPVNPIYQHAPWPAISFNSITMSVMFESDTDQPIVDSGKLFSQWVAVKLSTPIQQTVALGQARNKYLFHRFAGKIMRTTILDAERPFVRIRDLYDGRRWNEVCELAIWFCFGTAFQAFQYCTLSRVRSGFTFFPSKLGICEMPANGSKRVCTCCSWFAICILARVMRFRFLGSNWTNTVWIVMVFCRCSWKLESATSFSSTWLWRSLN